MDPLGDEMKTKKMVKPEVIARQDELYMISSLWREYDALALAVTYDGEKFSNPAPIGSFFKFDPYWDELPVSYVPPFEVPDNVVKMLNMTLDEFRAETGATFPHGRPK